MPVSPGTEPDDPNTCENGCHLAEDGMSFVLDSTCMVHG